MLLTCPTCRSGLEVPDGTTAMVRCPACKSVFSPAAGLAPLDAEPVEEEEEDDEEERRPARKPSRRPVDEDDEDDEDDRPRRRRRRARAEDDEEDDDEPENRDFDPGDPEEDRKRRKKRKGRDTSMLSPEEKRALRAAFDRAAWGCKLIYTSFALYLISMTAIVGFWFYDAMVEPYAGFMVAAGIVGAFGWVVGAIGLGLCLSGPPGPGHWGYGISAAVVTAVHLILVLALASQGKEYSPAQSIDPDGPASRWGLVATRLDAVTYYLTVLVYKGEDFAFLPKGKLNFSIVVGVFEIVRATLILMLLSCLAEAAGDKDLSHQCTRAAGYASYGPGFLAAFMFVFAALMIESRATVNNFTSIIFGTVVMGVYALLNGCMFPAFMVSREVADACEEPFQVPPTI